MRGTGLLAGAGAAPAVFMAAAAAPSGTAEVEWVGPFSPGLAQFPLTGNVTVVEEQVVHVQAAELPLLAASDPTWWLVL